MIVFNKNLDQYGFKYFVNLILIRYKNVDYFDFFEKQILNVLFGWPQEIFNDLFLNHDFYAQMNDTNRITTFIINFSTTCLLDITGYLGFWNLVWSATRTIWTRTNNPNLVYILDFGPIRLLYTELLQSLFKIISRV